VVVLVQTPLLPAAPGLLGCTGLVVGPSLPAPGLGAGLCPSVAPTGCWGPPWFGEPGASQWTALTPGTHCVDQTLLDIKLIRVVAVMRWLAGLWCWAIPGWDVGMGTLMTWCSLTRPLSLRPCSVPAGERARRGAAAAPGRWSLVCCFLLESCSL